MAVPFTPKKARMPDQGTASPRKQKSMGNAYEISSDKLKNIVNGINAALEHILADQTETPEAREASLYLIRVKIQMLIEHYGIDYEFQFKAPVQAPANTTTTNNGDFIDDSEASAEPDLSQPNLGQGNVVNTTTSNQAWLQVLIKDGLVQGDGTHEAPLFVGGTHLTADPGIIQITIDPGMGVTIERLLQVTELLFDEFSNLVWLGPIQFKETHQRLHLWAVKTWINFFIGEFFGAGGPIKLNHILKASDKVNTFGESRADADRALELSQNTDLTALERTFFQSMSVSISSGLSTNDAYSRFKNNHQCAVASFKFYEMVKEVTNNPEGELSKRVRKRGQAASGQNIQNQVAEACGKNMYWDKNKFQKWIDRHNVLSRCTFKFTGGFLLFVNPSMLTMARNSARGAIEQIVEIVDRVFPEYKAILGEVYKEVAMPLLSPIPAVNREVMGKKLATGAGGEDLISRIKAMKAGTE